MRFEEVTDRLSGVVSRPGKQGDGLPLNVAIPTLATMRIWQAVHGGYTWAISYEPGIDSWTDAEKEKHIGYTASYRRIGHNTSNETIKIDGGPWDSFTKAEQECGNVWRQIRSPN